MSEIRLLKTHYFYGSFFSPREVFNKLSKYCAKQNLQKFYDPSEMLEKKIEPI